MQEPRTVHAIYQAAWMDDRNIGDADVLAAVLTEAGFDAKALIAAADAADVKDRLKNNTAEAIGMGVCGVPTFQASQLLWCGWRWWFFGG